MAMRRCAAAAGADGVHLPAGSDPAAARALLGRQKLIGVSIHTVTEAEGIDPSSVDYVLAGPAFETASKPGYGPELGRKGLAEIARAAQRAGAGDRRHQYRARRRFDRRRRGRRRRDGSVMRAADPERETSALVSTLTGSLAIRGRDR